jgi:prepilin-type N-terminal cleavage/methylation domain-containing protein
MAIKRKNGFTLIEIILVLALAAIIMMMVFTALSAAQRARRDSQRKLDLATFFAKVEEYRANNADKHPSNQTELDAFAATYFDHRTDPLTGNPYVIDYWEANHNRRPVPGEILYGREHFCMVNDRVTSTDIINDLDPSTGMPTDFHHDHYMMIYQEEGEYYCIDNKEH